MFVTNKKSLPFLGLPARICVNLIFQENKDNKI